MEKSHDTGEERENTTRRDDSLEREFNSHADELFSSRQTQREVSAQRNDILFNEYLADRRKAREREDENVGERADNRSTARVQRDDRVSLEFRDSSAHSTANTALEAVNSVVAGETMENVPDEEHPADGS